MKRKAGGGRTIFGFVAAVALALAPARAGLAQTPSAEPADPIASVYYRFAVVEYCALVTRDVALGFEAERDRIVAALGADEERHRTGRIAGWVAADREWSNRGLGGFRNWCRTEGEAAAAGFAANAP